MPGTAGGMVRIMVRTVYCATSAGGGVGTSRPACLKMENNYQRVMSRPLQAFRLSTSLHTGLAACQGPP